MGSRTEQLTELAREAFGDDAVVTTFGEQHVRVEGEVDDSDVTLLEVRHPLADEALAVLAKQPGVMSIDMALDCVEGMLRARMTRHGLDIAGLRDGKVVFWTDDGVVATGASLRDALANLDKRRRRGEEPVERLPELGEGVETTTRIGAPLPPGVERIEAVSNELSTLEHDVQRLQFEGKRLADVGESLVRRLEIDGIKRARRAARYVAEELGAALSSESDPAAALAAYHARVDQILRELDVGDGDLRAMFDDLDGEVP